MATVKYIDFGITSAKDFWAENVVPAHERFKASPNRATAIDASVPAWHVHEWIWHDKYPGKDTDKNPDYTSFWKGLIKDCPELAWIRDVANAAKHRGLGRPPPKIKRVAKEQHIICAFGTVLLGSALPLGGIKIQATPLLITLNNGSRIGFGHALERVMNYLARTHFP